jgi:hypothetical protein
MMYRPDSGRGQVPDDNIVWGDQVRRQTRFFLGGLMGDQQATHYTPNISKYI